MLPWFEFTVSQLGQLIHCYMPNSARAMATTVIHKIKVFFAEDGAQSSPSSVKIVDSCKADFSNIGQVAVTLCEINTVAYNKFIRNFKP